MLAINDRIVHTKKRSEPQIRDSTHRDFVDICGRNAPCMFRGKTITRDGEAIAIAGLVLGKASMEAFSSVKPGVIYGKMEALRASIEITEWMRRQCSIVYLVLGYGKSDRYHRFIGFNYVMDWDGKRVYQLCQS